MLKNTLGYIYRNLIAAGTIAVVIGVLFLLFYRDQYFQTGAYLFTPNKGWTISACGVVLLLVCWIASRIARVKTIYRRGWGRFALSTASVIAAAAVIVGCAWFVWYLDGLHIEIGPTKFNCQNHNSGAAFEWGLVTNIQGFVSPSLPGSKRTDTYSWLNLSLGDMAIHMPLTFFSDPDFIISQTMDFWARYKAKPITP